MPVQKVVRKVSAPIKMKANYTVQIASFKEKKSAEKALTDIQIKVPSAYIASRNLGTKGTWYRIYAGQFELRNQAEVALSDIKQNFDSSFIICCLSDLPSENTGKLYLRYSRQISFPKRRIIR